MKPFADEKTCSNSAIDLAIAPLTCLGTQAESPSETKPQVGSHMAENAGAFHNGADVNACDSTEQGPHRKPKRTLRTAREFKAFAFPCTRY